MVQRQTGYQTRTAVINRVVAALLPGCYPWSSFSGETDRQSHCSSQVAPLWAAFTMGKRRQGYQLLAAWNGKSLFHFPEWDVLQDFSVTSDASGNVGFAAILGTHWFAQEWPCDAKNIDIAIKELVPICIAAVVWKHHQSRRRIKFRSDNSSVVACLRSGLCRDRHMALFFASSQSLLLFQVSPLLLFIYRANSTWLLTLSPVVIFRFSEGLSPNVDSEATPIPPGLVLKLLFPPWTRSGKP